MKIKIVSAVLVLMILVSKSEIFASLCLLALGIIGLCAFCVLLGDYEVMDE